MIVVERVGLRALVEDLGRPGHAAIGVAASGAADRGALRLGNRLVGNPEGAAGLEVLLLGATLRATADHLVAVTGAPCPLTIDGRPAPLLAPVAVAAGQRLALGPAAAGLRSYLAVRGGFAGDRVLGSLSTDTASGLGPAPLAAGDALAVFAETGADAAPPAPDALAAAPGGPLVLTGTWGPRADWLTLEARIALAHGPWRVGTATDRIGTRLDGPPLERAVADELPSEGVVRGAVQVPTGGRPLVFGSDHPVTGGYPVAAVVDEASVDALAQARPGTGIRFDLRQITIGAPQRHA